SDVQHAAFLQAGCEQVQRAGLDDTALIVACFRPRIREEDTDAVEGFWLKHAHHDLDAVAAHPADIVQPTPDHLAHELSQTWLVQLNGDDVGVSFQWYHCRS